MSESAAKTLFVSGMLLNIYDIPRMNLVAKDGLYFACRDMNYTQSTTAIVGFAAISAFRVLGLALLIGTSITLIILLKGYLRTRNKDELVNTAWTSKYYPTRVLTGSFTCDTNEDVARR